MSRLGEIKKYLWRDSSGPDEISAVLFKDNEDIYGMDGPELEAWQLSAARRRFDTLVPHVKALAKQAERAGITRINSLDDIAPLLFDHTQYKSYPLSFLENGRFDMLTRWLDSLTSVDLSGVDASGCQTIDGWLELLERETPLQPFHTSGTTGKLSVFPRTIMEGDFWCLSSMKMLESYRDEPGFKVGFDNVRLPVIYPSLRHGRNASSRLTKFLADHVTTTPQDCYTLSDGMMSADILSLSGRIRVAQAKGDLANFKLDSTMRRAFKKYLDDQEKQPQEVDRFMNDMMEKLKGRQVYISSQTNYIAKAAEIGVSRGISGVFSDDSVGIIGGGAKGVNLADNWFEIVQQFTGISNWVYGYGMTEMVGPMRRCKEGYFHLPCYTIAFLVDPETGHALPRQGTQTGRYAGLDLIPATYWGGIITGDKVTIEWDRACGCGRKGPHIHDEISRYSAAVTGDDKVTCSATIDNTDSALQALLAVQ